MYSSAWNTRNAAPRIRVSASQRVSGLRWFLRRAWWAKVRVKLELTSSTVLSKGRPQALMIPLGAG
ncbi:hypothetical protein D3C85_1237980 [compost metagenome]